MRLQRYTIITKLKPDKIEHYIELHNRIWPEVVALGHQAGLRNYTIHQIGTYLFSYYEYVGNNYEADMAWKNSHDIVKKWQVATGECFDWVTDADKTITPHEIFYHEF